MKVSWSCLDMYRNNNANNNRNENPNNKNVYMTGNSDIMDIIHAHIL